MEVRNTQIIISTIFCNDESYSNDNLIKLIAKESGLDDYEYKSSILAINWQQESYFYFNPECIVALMHKLNKDVILCAPYLLNCINYKSLEFDCITKNNRII